MPPTIRIAIAVLALVAARSTKRGEQRHPAAAVRYEHRTTAEPESIHLLEIEPRRARIVAVGRWEKGSGGRQFPRSHNAAAPWPPSTRVSSRSAAVTTTV